MTSGITFDLHALFGSARTLALVPIFLAVPLLARGVPALLYRSLLDDRRIGAAGLLQATSLGFIVVATQIGMELGLLTRAVAAAFVAGGLLSVLLFPLAAVTLLRRRELPEAVPAQPVTD